MGYAWIAVVFVGAFVLFGAIAWARRQNQKSDVSDRRTAEGTKALRRELNAEDQGRTP